MPDIDSNATHVIQALGKDGSWKNMTRHASLKDAKSNLPEKNPQNYRITTIAGAGLSKSTGDMGDSAKTRAYQSGKAKNTAVKSSTKAAPKVAAKPAPKVTAKPTAKKK